MAGLLTTDITVRPTADFVARVGKVPRRFDHRLQDLRNVSRVLETPVGRFFCKSADTVGPVRGVLVPYLDYQDRVQLASTSSDG